MACHHFHRVAWRLFFVPAMLVLRLGLSGPTAVAQSFDATNLRQADPLNVTWLVQAGDDPAYARPDFDDSKWMRVDPSRSLTDYFAGKRQEMVWYRLHIKVAPSEQGLGLEEWNLASAFEIYANGEQILKNGHVQPFAPWTFGAHLLVPLPEKAVATGSVVLALRIHISRTEWSTGFPGLYPGNLVLGRELALHDHIWLDLLGQNTFLWLNAFFGFSVGLVALVLFTAQRRQTEYVWLFLWGLCNAIVTVASTFALTANFPVLWQVAPRLIDLGTILLPILTYFAFLRLQMRRWLRIYLAATLTMWLICSVGEDQSWMPAQIYLASIALVVLVQFGLVPFLLFVHFRRGNREAGILMVPALLSGIVVYFQIVLFLVGQIPLLRVRVNQLQHRIFTIPAGPFSIGLNDLLGALSWLSLAIIMILRSTRISRQQALLEGEMAAAREVQQVILPEQAETIPGFTVESIYQPAQQVGGDFFQILPADGGGLLVVVGDVAGKGLPAAMLVSVLVGAIRGVAEYTKNPAELLANLNDRLVGRAGGGFSTALVAHIAADGRVTIANAGHLSPYLDGKEIELPGALPLGVQSGARYETTQFWLAHGSRLTFYSDGVVEAQSQTGELFGFERGREHSTRPAAAIAKTAQQFGQQDDITVVTIERARSVATAA